MTKYFSKIANNTIFCQYWGKTQCPSSLFCPFLGKTECSSKFCSHQLFSILTKYHCVKLKKKTSEEIPSNTGFRWTDGLMDRQAWNYRTLPAKARGPKAFIFKSLVSVYFLLSHQTNFCKYCIQFIVVILIQYLFI